MNAPRYPSWPSNKSPYGDLSVAVTNASDGSGRFIVNLESMTEQLVTVDVTVDGTERVTLSTL
jgi:hypothetical protein